MAPRFKVGEEVWVKDEHPEIHQVFSKGDIRSIDGDKVTVETSTGAKTQELVLPLAEIFKVNPEGDVPDHCQLLHLSPPTLLWNTIKRFEKDLIYTSVGDILVAVNPFQWITGLYGQERMNEVKGKKFLSAACGPHPYGIGEKAFVTMARARVKSEVNQCIIVSGESGAGKTEANKHLMEYLVWRGSTSEASKGKGTEKKAGGMGGICERIMDLNPILEAFGNAKTTRNNNSSRFGRYVLLQFTEENEIVGAEIRTFLLERSRVTSSTSAHERSYHVLYQVATAFAECRLPLSGLHYLSMSGTTEVDGMDDAKLFKATSKAMLSLNMKQAQIDTIWSYLTAMLYLGNLKFGNGDVAQVMNEDDMYTAERLLGCQGFQQLLVSRAIVTRGERTCIDYSPQQALLARDSLAKVMYDRLFNYLVVSINETVNNPKDAKRTIGLLDVFGFEHFETNSFEQLCINFANEKLQQYFLQVVFKGEERTYKDEGVPWQPTPYPDNAHIIALFETPVSGIYATLESQSRTPNASGRTFCQQLYNTHGGASSKVFGPPKLGKGASSSSSKTFDSRASKAAESRTSTDHFVIKHFAGDVVYCSDEFLDKNNDSFDADFEQALLASKHEVVVKICTPSATPGSARKPASSFGTVSSKFLKSLAELMAELNSSTAHFIRCIKPNDRFAPRELESVSVVSQLRLSGTLDAVRLIQEGYPTRIPYDTIHGRYKKMMPKEVQALPPPQFCEVVGEVCGVGKSDYYLGTKRMFFRLGAAATLEELAELDPAEIAPILSQKLKQFELKKGARPLIENDLRMWLAKRGYELLLREKRKRDAEEAAKRQAEEGEAGERASMAALGDVARMQLMSRKFANAIKTKVAEVETTRNAQRSSTENAWKRAMAGVQAERKGGFAGMLYKIKKAKELAERKAEAERLEAAEPKGEIVPGERMLDALDLKIQELEDASDLEEAVQQAGGVPAIISASQEHLGSPRVQTKFVRVLGDICISDRLATDISAGRGLEAIIEAARSHIDSAELQVAVADALRNLSELPEIALGVSRLGGIETLLEALNQHPEETGVQAGAAGALWALSVHDEAAAMIADASGADALVAAAKQQPQNAELQASAAGAIRNLSITDSARRLIAHAGGVSVLVAAAENHPFNEQIQAQVTGALRNLSLNEEVALRIVESAGVEALVGASTSHPGSIKVQWGVAGALRNLAVNDEIAEKILSVGGIEALIIAAEEHPESADVCAEVAGALWGLAVNPELEHAIALANGLQTLVTAAKNHHGHVKVQARVAGALRMLSASKANKREIAYCGGVRTLVKASRLHLTNAAVQAGVAGALSNLSIEDDLELSIGSEGGIQALIEAAHAHVSDVKVQARVVRALANLTVNVRNQSLFASLRGVDTLIQAAQVHADSAEVQAGVAGALRNLSVSSQIANIVIGNEAVALMLRASLRHSGDPILQAGIAGALRNLSLLPQHWQYIIQGKGVDTLLLAAKLHRRNKKVQRQVAAALRHLETPPANAHAYASMAASTSSLTSGMSHPLTGGMGAPATPENRHSLQQCGSSSETLSSVASSRQKRRSSMRGDKRHRLMPILPGSGVFNKAFS